MSCCISFTSVAIMTCAVSCDPSCWSLADCSAAAIIDVPARGTNGFCPWPLSRCVLLSSHACCAAFGFSLLMGWLHCL